jgi:L,D-transpeptidase ErfK/SrfK
MLKLKAQTNSRLSSVIQVTLLVLLCFYGEIGTAHALQSALQMQIVGGESPYVVRQGDSLTALSARMGVDVRVLAADNGLPPTSALHLAQELRVNNLHIVRRSLADGIVINIPQRMLFYFREGQMIRHFPVGLGRPDWRTPIGDFTITVKEENPTWDVPQSIQEEMRREGKPVLTCVPPGPDNPLGKHWLGLSIAGIGIHGTIAPASIYRFQTHGCIRAHPEDIAGLFPLVSRGTRGTLLYKPLLVAKIGDKLYLEVHRDIYRREPDLRESFAQAIRDADLGSLVDRFLAEDIIRKQEGIARDISIGGRITDERRSSTPATER